LQVLSKPEIDFPYTASLEFEDLESGERRVIDAGVTAGAYRSGIGSFLTRCRREAHRDGHDYALLRSDISPERALRSYLIRRTGAADPTAPRETR
jgi:hypothetical protein